MQRVSLHSELEERRLQVLLVSPGAQQDQRGSQVYELQGEGQTVNGTPAPPPGPQTPEGLAV